MKKNACILFTVSALVGATVIAKTATAADISGIASPEVGAYGIDGTVQAIVGDPCSTREQAVVASGEITMGTGAYTIQGLPAGEYYLSAQISLIDNLREWWAQPESTPLCSKAKKIKVGEIENVTGVNFQLDPAASIGGRIHGGSGPLKDTLVEIYSGSPCGSNRLVTSTLSSSNGSYFLGMLPAGYYFLKASPKNYRSTWWASAGSSLSCSGAEAIAVTKGSALAGKNFEVNEMGGQVAGTTIDATTNTPTVFADVELYTGDPCGVNSRVKGSPNFRKTSSYRVGGLPGGVYFAKASGYYSEADPLALFVPEWWNGTGSSPDCKQAQAIEVKDKRTQGGIDFQLEHGGVISGTKHRSSDTVGQQIPKVRAFFGKPCGDHQLVAENEIGMEDGRYSITGLQAGTYYLSTVSVTGKDQKWWAGSKSSSDCSAAKLVTVGPNERVVDKDFYPEQ